MRRKKGDIKDVRWHIFGGSWPKAGLNMRAGKGWGRGDGGGEGVSC